MTRLVNEVPTTNPVAVSASQLAAMLNVSLRHIRRMDACGKIPDAVSIGYAKRWLAEEILEWLRMGSPDRRSWNILKKQRRRVHGV